MIVLDASAAIDLLLELQPAAGWVEERLAEEAIHAPSVIDLEVTAAMQKLVSRQVIEVDRAELALVDLVAMPVNRYPSTRLLERIWALRENLTPYDAAYVALAETLDATLLTTDDRLARAPGHLAAIESYPG